MLNIGKHRIFFLILPLLFFLGAIGLRAAPPGAAAMPANAAAQGAGAGYVGEEVCLTCHADQEKRFRNTVMGKAFAHPRTGQEKWGCETCHGPGKAHVDAGGGKDTIPLRFGRDSANSIDEQNASCLDCHHASAISLRRNFSKSRTPGRSDE